MKKLAIFFVAVATLAMTSCGMLNSSSNSVAQAAGQTCGTAVLTLYRAYKASGTIDLTNANNLSSALALATCYTQIKQNKDNANYRKAFTNGLILSSSGLITNENAGAFVNTLINANGLANTSQTSTTAQNNTQLAPAVTKLVKTL